MPAASLWQNKLVLEDPSDCYWRHIEPNLTIHTRLERSNGWVSRRLMCPWTFSSTKRFCQWDFLWGSACPYLPAPDRNTGRFREPPINPWRHAANCPSYTQPQKHDKKDYQQKKKKMPAVTHNICLDPPCQWGVHTSVCKRGVIKCSFHCKTLKYTMVWIYRASAHIWRAHCWSQSLNITTAATVWEASMSAVGEQSWGKKISKWFLQQQMTPGFELDHILCLCRWK